MLKSTKIYFGSAEDAGRVADVMGQVIDKFGEATVADLFDFTGIPLQYERSHEWSETRFGWKSLAELKLVETEDGTWFIDFPPVEKLH